MQSKGLRNGAIVSFFVSMAVLLIGGYLAKDRVPPVPAHTALFGTYGMLAISLILFSWRGLVDKAHWKDGLLKLSFWGLNGGLALMAFTSLLPVGLSQTWHSFADGLWYARSADFYELPLVQALGNWRLVPDTIIIVCGALPLLWFLVSTFPRLRKISVADKA